MSDLQGNTVKCVCVKGKLAEIKFIALVRIGG